MVMHQSRDPIHPNSFHCHNFLLIPIYNVRITSEISLEKIMSKSRGWIVTTLSDSPGLHVGDCIFILYSAQGN